LQLLTLQEPPEHSLTTRVAVLRQSLEVLQDL